MTQPLGVRIAVAAVTAAIAAGGLVYMLSLVEHHQAPAAPPSTAQTKSPLADQTLPGFSATLGIKIRDAAALRRQYLFEYETPEGSRVGLTLSPSGDRFSVLAIDVHGDVHSLDVAIGNEGIPIYQFIFLTCEVGTATNATYIRALVDGKEIQARTLPFRIDLGSRQWKQGKIGADMKGENYSAFSIAAANFGHVTLTNQNIEDLIKLLRTYLVGVGYNFKGD